MLHLRPLMRSGRTAAYTHLQSLKLTDGSFCQRREEIWKSCVLTLLARNIVDMTLLASRSMAISLDLSNISKKLAKLRVFARRSLLPSSMSRKAASLRFLLRIHDGPLMVPLPNVTATLFVRIRTQNSSSSTTVSSPTIPS
jgi:hypothetical protein